MRRLAMLLIAAFLVIGCTNSPKEATTQEKTAPPVEDNQPDPQEAASDQPELAFGQSGTVGGATVTVQAPYWGKPPDYGTEEGFELAVFKVRWEATRDRVVTPTFTVTMDGGEQFTRNPQLASNGSIMSSPIWEGDQLILTELDAGDWVRGQVAFVLPRERGTLYVKGDEDAPVLTYRFGPESTGSLPSGYGSKIINRPPDPAAETQALNERFAAWNRLVAEADDDVRVAKLRWDNEELFKYLNFWMYDEMVEDRSYPFPFTGNSEAAQGVLFETASPLMPTGSSHRDVCRLNEPGQVYKGDAGDHTRYYWGWVTCRGQIETIHAKLRYFRDAEGIDHAMVQLLKTPPLGG